MEATYTLRFTGPTQAMADAARDAARSWLLDTGEEDNLSAYAEGEGYYLEAGAETGTSRTYAVTV